MSIKSTRTAFWWMLFALFISAYVILTNFAHIYESPYWEAGWINVLMGFSVKYAWKIGFVILLVAIVLFLYLISSHAFYYVRWIYRKIKGFKQPPSERELLNTIIDRLDTLVNIKRTKEG